MTLRPIVATLIALVALTQLQTAVAQGQKYAALKVPDNMKDRTTHHSDVRRIKKGVASGSMAFNDNKNAIREWYESYLFKSFTHPDKFHEIPAKRKELLRDLKSSERSPAFRQYLLGQTKKFMQVFARSDHPKYTAHPVVRFNAMLIMGELNSVESSATNRIAVPDPQALGFMVTEFKKETQIAPVKVAALIGILRHATLDYGRWKMPTNSRKGLATMMVQLLEQSAPAEGTDPGVHLWMRRRAADILGALGVVGAMPEVDQAIDKIVSNPDEDVHLRCTAASTYALLDAKNHKLDLAKTSMKLGALAATASRAELDWIKAYKQQKAAEEATPGAGELATSSTGQVLDTSDAASMMGVDTAFVDESLDESSGFDGLGGGNQSGTGDPVTDSEIKLTRRRFLTRLYSVKKGLEGLEGVLKTAEGPAKAQFDQVMLQFNTLVAATIPPEDDQSMDGIARSMRRAVAEMEQLTEAFIGKAAERTVPVGASDPMPAPAATGS